MIDDLDRILDVLLRHELPPTIVDQVALSFATPYSKFPPPSVTLSAIDLFAGQTADQRAVRPVSGCTRLARLGWLAG